MASVSRPQRLHGRLPVLSQDEFVEDSFADVEHHTGEQAAEQHACEIDVSHSAPPMKEWVSDACHDHPARGEYTTRRFESGDGWR